MTEATKTAAALIREARAAEQAARRADLIVGLRGLADLLESQPDVPRPSSVSVTIFADDEAGARAVLGRAVLIDYKIVRDRGTEPRHRFQAKLQLGGVEVAFWADPAWVCEQSGTRTVEVPDWTFRGEPVRL